MLSILDAPRVRQDEGATGGPCAAAFRPCVVHAKSGLHSSAAPHFCLHTLFFCRLRAPERIRKMCRHHVAGQRACGCCELRLRQQKQACGGPHAAAIRCQTDQYFTEIARVARCEAQNCQQRLRHVRLCLSGVCATASPSSHADSVGGSEWRRWLHRPHRLKWLALLHPIRYYARIFHTQTQIRVTHGQPMSLFAALDSTAARFTMRA